jgi:thiol-disulfide isomerase/thioredoxin
MRKLLTSLALAGLVTACASASDKKDDKKPDADKQKESSKLKVGDPAPSLKATKWLQGTEVQSFAPGKLYVVEFWATWCGPCIVMMPHMGELQTEYKDKGLTIIGYTAKDANNTADKVASFVTKRGPKLGYTFAYGDDRDTYDAWMTAAGQNGIPCSFVIDQKGKIVYIGHPMYLGEVLPKVVAGSWKAEEGATELAEIEKDVNSIFRKLNSPDAEKSLKALTDFEARRPGLAKIPYFVGPKISLLIKAKKLDEAKKVADAVLAKAIEQEDTGALRTVASSLRSPEPDKEISDRSLKAAEVLLKISGDKDLMALLTVADAYHAAGDDAKARAFGKQAIDASPEGLRPQIEGIVKKYAEEKKEEKKPEKKDDDKNAEKK